MKFRFRSITSRRGLCNYEAPTVYSATDVRLGMLVKTDAPAGMKAYVGAKDDLTFGFLFGCPIYGANITPSRVDLD